MTRETNTATTNNREIRTPQSQSTPSQLQAKMPLEPVEEIVSEKYIASHITHSLQNF